MQTGLYFQDYEVGVTMVTRGRTITETDIVQFGALTGDFNPMHFDAEYMKTHMMGQRIAHGMLSLSYAVGQAYRNSASWKRRSSPSRSLEMKFSLPVLIGDTLHVRAPQ
ncbi:MAG: hypothetical protein HND48_14215 [Chloroflexi bacterium]|nr:hypothetical protein [Chloroflexota bacterium]